MWTGPRPGPEGAEQQTGVTARPVAALRPTLDSLLAALPQLYVVSDAELDDDDGGSADASTLALLDPGSYTMQITAGSGTASGEALVEIYEVP